MKKISRREFLTVVAAASAAGLLSACGGSSGGTTSTSAAGGGAASGQSINLRIASSSPTVEFEGDGTTALGISALYFVNQISARTDGRITAQIFPDGQIASSTQEYIGGLQNGAFDIGILNCGSWGDYTSAFAGLNMPYLYLNYDEAYAVLDSEVGQSWLQKAQEDTTPIPLAFFDIGFRELTCNNEVHTPDDLKGVKIRVMPDPIQTATWDALVMTIHNFTATIPAISPVIWNQLSADDQQLIRDVMVEAQNEGRKHTAELADGFIQTVEDDAGTKVIYLTDDELKAFQDKVKEPIWPMVEKQMGTDAYNALISFVEDYEAGKK